MIRTASNLLALLAFVLLRSSGNRPGSIAPAPGPAGREVPLTRTGEADVGAWARRRMALTVTTLGALEPPVPADKAEAVALSLLAQWAHETDNGKAEFNFNLGGWTARRRDNFHTARDRLSDAAGFRWTAYADLGTAIEDQVNRLIRQFPSAWGLLLAAPKDAAWVRELGARGYYTADPDDYAPAWVRRRLDLGKVLP